MFASPKGNQKLPPQISNIVEETEVSRLVKKSADEICEILLKFDITLDDY